MSLKEGGQTYLFGPFVVDTREGLLLREGRPVQLTPKAFEVLVALVEHSGHCIGKDELMRRVWPDSFVEENNLSQNISQVRRALQTEGEVLVTSMVRDLVAGSGIGFAERGALSHEGASGEWRLFKVDRGACG